MIKLFQKYGRYILNFGLLLIGLILVASNIALGSSAVAIKPWLSIFIFIIEIYFILRFFGTFKFRLLTGFISLIFLVLMVLQIRYFVICLQNPGTNQRVVNILFVTFFQFDLLVLSSIPVLARSISSGLLTLEGKLNGLGSRIYMFSLILWAGVVLVYSPVTVFSSSWQEVEIGIFSLLPWLFLYLIIFLISAYFIYRIVPGELKVLFVYIIFFTALVFLFYTYILPGNFGHLDKFEFSKPEILYNPVSLYLLLEVIGLIIAFILIAFILRRFPRQVFSLLVILNLMTFGQTMANVLSSGVFNGKTEKTISSSKPPAYYSELLSFSREQNVLVIMLDMFCGGFMPEILEKNPELYEKYQGFTWYANTLSTSVSTYSSLPSLVGGSGYTVEKTGELEDETLGDRYAAAFKFFPDFFKTQNFSVAFADPSYQDINLTKLEGAKDVLLGRSVDFIPYWENHQAPEYRGDTRIPASEYSRIFTVIGLFKGSPFFLKPKIYYKGSWLKTNHGNIKIRHAVKELALLDVASELSNADSPRKTFKYISSSMTHIPWPFDSDGHISKTFIKSNPQLIRDPETGKMFDNPLLPYNASVKALKVLAEWFDWMKREGIYDNTRIIIVSDHGNSGIDPMFKDLRVIRNSSGRILEGSGRSHPILLVKDFNQNEPLVRSDHFSSNSDTAAFATMGIAKKDPLVNPLTIDSDSRVLTLNFVSSKPSTKDEKKYRLWGQFQVKGSLFEKKNWTDILN